MTSVVDRLERDGWVVRGPDPGDRRVTCVQITPAGREALDHVLGVLGRDEECLEHLVDRADLARLVRSLDEP